GSMHQSVTGYRKGSSSKVRCVDVAALVTAAILRKNPEATVLPFEGKVVDIDLNPLDSVMTNAKKLASIPAGATNCSAPLRLLNSKKASVSMVIFISDNESWIDSSGRGYYNYATATMQEWNQIKSRNSDAKMACIDIVPNTTVQAKSDRDILNIGGFSDLVFQVLSAFAAGQLGKGCASALIDAEVV
ncbi:MAG: RNA-binding protein, partial [Pseudobacteriovorax sp.]|nr:RNA-binding protein [Pseudobacteriovorax sp.]